MSGFTAIIITFISKQASYNVNNTFHSTRSVIRLLKCAVRAICMLILQHCTTQRGRGKSELKLSSSIATSLYYTINISCRYRMSANSTGTQLTLAVYKRLVCKIIYVIIKARVHNLSAIDT